MQRRTALSGMIALAVLGACSDGAGPDGARVSLTFATTGAAAAPAPGFSASLAADTLRDGQNELVISSAEIVLREIELKRVETSDCDNLAADEDACEKFEVGPILLDVPLDGGTAKMVTIPIQPGAYDELEFEIHKVSNDAPEDAAFRQAHPDMVESSIRIRGTFNGQDFTYVTDLDVEQEFDLFPALVVEEGTVTTNVTVRMDLSRWFRDGSGALMDPLSANKGGVNEGLVKENIKQNIEAFEDRDGDGDNRDEG